jgi:hypothetical protein
MFAHGVGSLQLDMTLVEEAEEDVAVFYAVSESNTWIPGSVYDCPSGYHWASTAEGTAYFKGSREGTGAYRSIPPTGACTAVCVMSRGVDVSLRWRRVCCCVAPVCLSHRPLLLRSVSLWLHMRRRAAGVGSARSLPRTRVL